MRNTSSDNFEAIAKDAVMALTAAALTLKLIGEKELASAIAEKASQCVDRAIALGGV
jgi:hypothetical protein